MKIPIDQIDSEFVKSESIDEAQLKDMADSMAEQGQLHPVIVRRANGSLQLVAGEKRLLAAKMLGWAEIEAEVKVEITDDEAKILRVHENLRRFNLPWFEQVVLVEQLHNIRQSQHGTATGGRPSKGAEKKGWGIRDTAEELGVAIGPLSEDINLARAVRFDPSLRNIKDKKTAVRLVRLAARRIESEREAGLPVDIETNQVYLGDSALVLSKFPSACFDGCITDPPWLSFYDAALTRDERTTPVFKEIYRTLKYNTLMFVFVGWDDFIYYAGFDKMDEKGEVVHVPGELERIGFQCARTPVIWHKKNALSRRGVRPWEYDRDFEIVVIAAKGNPVLAQSTRLSAIKEFPAVPPVKLIHPNEKPVELIKELLDDAYFEGNVIVDPFGGSGVVGQACKEMKRRFTVIERDKKFYDGIRKRLKMEEK